MAKKKKEEVSEETKKVEDQEAKEINVEEVASVKDTAAYERITPFGVEVWDPKTKTTTMKTHG